MNINLILTAESDLVSIAILRDTDPDYDFENIWRHLNEYQQTKMS